MKIGDRIFVRGYIDEIRKDTVIVRNDGGYFGTVLSEVTGELPSAQPEKRTEKRTETHACDLIDREAAIRAVNTALFPKINTAKDAEKALRDLPSAQPERMRGRWQEITASDCSGYDPVLAGYDDPVVGYVCSVCHEGYEKEVMGKTTWDFCPNCGADMRGEQE